ncbi:hypothetical protein HDU96_005108 [Phlyctochytrium bullatum]|nr:hypothetical protein HDU96_005108 [Phlyctochytrium bullatum]
MKVFSTIVAAIALFSGVAVAQDVAGINAFADAMPVCLKDCSSSVLGLQFPLTKQTIQILCNELSTKGATSVAAVLGCLQSRCSSTDYITIAGNTNELAKFCDGVPPPSSSTAAVGPVGQQQANAITSVAADATTTSKAAVAVSTTTATKTNGDVRMASVQLGGAVAAVLAAAVAF